MLRKSPSGPEPLVKAGLKVPSFRRSQIPQLRTEFAASIGGLVRMVTHPMPREEFFGREGSTPCL